MLTLHRCLVSPSKSIFPVAAPSFSATPHALHSELGASSTTPHSRPFPSPLSLTFANHFPIPLYLLLPSQASSTSSPHFKHAPFLPHFPPYPLFTSSPLCYPYEPFNYALSLISFPFDELSLFSHPFSTLFFPSLFPLHILLTSLPLPPQSSPLPSPHTRH